LKPETLTLTAPVIVGDVHWMAKQTVVSIEPRCKMTDRMFWITYIHHSTYHIDCVLWKLVWFVFRLFDDAALSMGITRFGVLSTSGVNNTVFDDTRPYHLTRAVELQLKMDDGGISNSVDSACALQSEGSAARVAPSWSVVPPCYVERHWRNRLHCPLMSLSLFWGAFLQVYLLLQKVNSLFNNFIISIIIISSSSSSNRA
jgi:hypothetical protein